MQTEASTLEVSSSHTNIQFSLNFNPIIHELSVISSPGLLFVPSESISARQLDELSFEN